MRTILIPLDGSPLGEQALPIGRVLAQRAGAAVHLVHVRNPYQPFYVQEGVPVVDEQLRPLRELHERTYLERVRARLQEEAGVEVQVALLEGPTAQTLSAYANTTGSDLIIMTTHGYGGFERFWLGSVADALVRMSGVPVLLRRSHGPDSTEGEGFV